MTDIVQRARTRADEIEECDRILRQMFSHWAIDEKRPEPIPPMLRQLCDEVERLEKLVIRDFQGDVVTQAAFNHLTRLLDSLRAENAEAERVIGRLSQAIKNRDEEYQQARELLRAVVDASESSTDFSFCDNWYNITLSIDWYDKAEDEDDKAAWRLVFFVAQSYLSADDEKAKEIERLRAENAKAKELLNEDRD